MTNREFIKRSFAPKEFQLERHGASPPRDNNREVEQLPFKLDCADYAIRTMKIHRRLRLCGGSLSSALDHGRTDLRDW
jgi:hypothetical protein